MKRQPFKRHKLELVPQPPRCLSRREGDEWVCPTCTLRWDVGDVRPACLKGN